MSVYFALQTSKTTSTLSSDKRYAVGLALLFLWMLWGIFPLFNSYEGDAQFIIVGASVLCNDGFQLPPVISYQYGMQPAIIWIIAALHKLIPFLTCSEIYCGLTALVALAAIPLRVEFVHRLTGFGRDIVLLAFFLLPETYAISTYPNTAIFADFLALVAFLLIIRGGSPFAYLTLLCIAPLFRIDIIIIYPVVFFLWMHAGEGLWKSMKRSIFAAIVVLAVMSLLYWLLKANPSRVLANAESNNQSHLIMTVVCISLFTFYNIVNLILIPIGIWIKAKQRDFLLLLVAIVPMILLHYIYRNNGGAAKHYLYLLSFIAILSSQALCFLGKIGRRHRWAGWTMLAILLLYYTLSIRFHVPDRPWRNSPTSFSQAGFHLPLFEENRTPYHMEIGIGAGLGVATSDELMLLSGGLFYTDYIHRIKNRDHQYLHKAKDYLGQSEDQKYGMLFVEWSDIPLYPSLLLDEGYHFRWLDKESFELSDGNRRVTAYTMTTEHECDLIVSQIKKALSKRRPDDGPLYILTQADSYIYTLEKLSKQGLCHQVAHGLYLIHSDEENYKSAI